MDVIVTAGGTAEPIDDVRAVTNFSTGRFPIEIARAFAARGETVTVLASREAGLRIGEVDDDATLEVRAFGDTTSLAGELSDAAAQLTPSGRPASCVVVHAAAVSDYRPVRHHGKLSSGADTLTITMERTPKVIGGLRERYGKRAFLVGCKLTSGSTPTETIAAARALIGANRLNLAIANDLTECRNGKHPCWLVTPEGGAIRVEGDRVTVARRIVEFIERRADVTWTATNMTPAGPAPDVSDRHRHLMSQLISFAHQASLLPAHDGNVAVRVDPLEPSRTPELLVTPRQVDKSTVDVDDCLAVRVDLDAYRTDCYSARGDARPSIDTSVQARILIARPGTAAILHTHELFGRPHARTPFPLPCGAAEEAGMVVAALDGHTGTSWAVELVEHGWLLGVDADTLGELAASYRHAHDLYMEHLDDVDADLEPGTPLHPVVDCADGTVRVVGIVAVTGHGAAVHLNPETRGTGIGRLVAGQLTARRMPVATVDECGVVDYWTAHGFDCERRPDRIIVCRPPAVVDTTLV